jgi:hydroxypyruvate isomerase
MTLSLCLEMVLTELPFVKRMETAARRGYRAVEFWDWRDKDIEEMRNEAARLGLRIAAMSGNRRHSLIDPGARAGLIRRKAPWIGYVHCADMPGRGAPGTGTIDYRAVGEALESSRYHGFVGLEFGGRAPEADSIR